MIVAHGIGAVKDLPIPGWMFLWGAAVVLVLSFLAFGVLWRRPVLEQKSVGRALPQRLSAVLTSRPVDFLFGALSSGLLIVVLIAAVLGEPNVAENIAPTFVYVVFWLGLVLLSVLFGNVWPVLNPWRAIARAVSWIWSRLGLSWETLSYPERLGRWPAAFMLFAFLALELTYIEPASPRALALAIAFYSYANWFAMAAFGIDKWCERGEGFTSYFGLLARIAPFARRGREIIVRAPFSGLAGIERVPGTLAFIAVMLGSVAFDGISRGRWWADLNIRVQVESGESLAWLMRVHGLVAAIALVALVYMAATALSARIVGARRWLVQEFLLSLVPIALVYAIAHYLSLRESGSVHVAAGLGPIREGMGSLRHSERPASADNARSQHALVHAGGCADRRACRRAGSGTRSSAGDLPQDERCASLPVPDARHDGRLHRRRPLPPRPELMAAVVLEPSIVAHGGAGGAAIEVLLTIGILSIFVAVWIRERRARRNEGEDDEELTDERLFRSREEDEDDG